MNVTMKIRYFFS